MKEQILGLGKRLWADFRAFSPGQKAVTVAAALALVVGGVMFFTWKSSPSYAPLYTNLAPSDASAIVDKLNSENVPYKLAQAGSEIMVPQKDIYSARLKISAAGLPQSSQTGYSLLDKEGVTTSQFEQQVDYQRAMEGELDKTIQSMNGVQAASVHLALPQQNVFNDGTQKPTAAVMLTLAGGTQLSSGQVQSVVYLVSSAVPNLAAKSVTVTDSAGNVLSAPGGGVTDATSVSTQSQATKAYNHQLQTHLENMIDKTLGTGHSIVNVNSVLDFDKTSTTTNNYVPNRNSPPLSEQKDTETYTGSGSGPAGTLGAGSGVSSGSSKTGKPNKYKKTQVTRDNAVGTQKKTVHSAPGSVKHLSISVLLDGKPTTVNLGKIQSLVKSYVGFKRGRGDTLSVQAMPFNNSAANQAAKAAAAARKAAAAKAAHQHLISLIKQGGLVLLIAALIIGTWLASRKRKKGGDDDELVEPLDDFLHEPGAAGGAAEPAPEPQTVPVANPTNEAATRRHALVALADEQPDDVARVLSGWLSSRE